MCWGQMSKIRKSRFANVLWPVPRVLSSSKVCTSSLKKWICHSHTAHTEYVCWAWETHSTCRKFINDILPKYTHVRLLDADNGNVCCMSHLLSVSLSLLARSLSRARSHSLTHSLTHSHSASQCSVPFLCVCARSACARVAMMTNGVWVRFLVRFSVPFWYHFGTILVRFLVLVRFLAPCRPVPTVKR